jgi:Uma2 family endonuclease
MVEAARRTPMAWSDYLELGEDVRGEYIDGCLVVSAAPSLRHQRAASRLERILEAGLRDGFVVVQGWGWLPRGATEEFIPDVMVAPESGEQIRFTGVPTLLVEVLSINARDDQVIKSGKYAKYGAPRFWLVDPALPAISAYELGEDRLYHLVAEAGAGESVTLDSGAGLIVLDANDLID